MRRPVLAAARSTPTRAPAPAHLHRSETMSLRRLLPPRRKNRHLGDSYGVNLEVLPPTAADRAFTRRVYRAARPENVPCATSCHPPGLRAAERGRGRDPRARGVHAPPRILGTRSTLPTVVFLFVLAVNTWISSCELPKDELVFLDVAFNIFLQLLLFRYVYSCM